MTKVTKHKRYKPSSQHHINYKHKDRLFRLIFQEKKDILDLYNAVNHTNYENEADLEINTLDDVIYLGMKNDLSFLIGNTLNLYEHQSTFCANMPLRGLIYLADVFQGYIEANTLDIYSSGQVKLPFPKYMVFYNGTKEEPDCTELKLSTAFLQPEVSGTPCLECTATMLNINFGHNQELLRQCKKLGEYAVFVSKIRKNIGSGMSLELAVDKAVTECIQEMVLKDILIKNRAEVVKVVLTEYNEKLHLDNLRDDAKAEGMAEGLAEGKAKGKAEGKAEAILCLLEELEPVSSCLKDKIMAETSLETLGTWLKIAIKSTTVVAFERNIKEEVSLK